MLVSKVIRKIESLFNKRPSPKNLLGELLQGSSLMGNLTTMLSHKNPILLFYVDVTDFHQVVQVQGDYWARQVLDLLQSVLQEKAKVIVNCSEEILVQNIWGDDFLLLCQPITNIQSNQLIKLSTAMRIALEEDLRRELIKLTGINLRLHVGCTTIDQNTNHTPEHRLYNAIKEAQKVAKGTWSQQTVHLLPEFNDLLSQKAFHIVYQPIVSLQTGEIFGWEALTRGPKDSFFGSPSVIFNFAEEVGLLFPLEKICRELAIKNFGISMGNQKLFLNIHPYTVNDPQFVAGETRRLLRDNHFSEANLVFEITERQSIQDFGQFNKTLSHYRRQGYRVAVDDAGAGFSSLQAIAEVRPEFIKIDSSLVRDIHTNRVRQALLETFVIFAQKIGCSIIAEGIETEEELTTLYSIGVHYGQGYYLGRPAFPKPAVTKTALNKIASLTYRNPTGVWQRAFPIGEICEPSVQVNIGTPVKNIKEILDANELLSGIVVTDDGQPAGLIMRHHLARYLGTQYGAALYFQRSAYAIMDPHPLVVDATDPIEQVSQQAMCRDKIKIYDYIIVTHGNKFHGIVSVEILLDTMTKIRIEMARGANPLTGLPGNLTIEREINTRLVEQSPFSLIYLDLDHFKCYNDRYGFENGDRLILLAARLLTSVVRNFGLPTDFIGHVGGDDFVVITRQDRSEEICRKYIRYFDRLVRNFYSIEDKQIGGFYWLDRQGQENWFPLVSASFSILDCSGHCTPEALAQKAAHLKHLAKKKVGSVYVRGCNKEV